MLAISFLYRHYHHHQQQQAAVVINSNGNILIKYKYTITMWLQCVVKNSNDFFYSNREITILLRTMSEQNVETSMLRCNDGFVAAKGPSSKLWSIFSSFCKIEDCSEKEGLFWIYYQGTVGFSAAVANKIRISHFMFHWNWKQFYLACFKFIKKVGWALCVCPEYHPVNGYKRQN